MVPLVEAQHVLRTTEVNKRTNRHRYGAAELFFVPGVELPQPIGIRSVLECSLWGCGHVLWLTSARQFNAGSLALSFFLFFFGGVGVQIEILPIASVCH
jgi:hypothetical protein